MSFYAKYPVSGGGSGGGVNTYPNFASLPATAPDGTLAVTLDTYDLYVFDAGTMMWELLATPGAEVNNIGTIDSNPASANGASISGSSLFMQSASVSVPGLVNLTTQSFAGNKTFTGTLAATNLSGTNTGDLTLGAVGSSPNANAASLSAQVLTLQPFNSSFPGVVTASGGGTTNFLRADGTWQAPAGMAGITALTGDGTATGPGSVAFTLATVNTNTGSFGSSTSIPSFTVNGKGLITAASGNAVIAPAGTLSGTTLNATVVSSSLTSLGTIATGVWQGTPVVPQYGGTGLATLTAYAVLCGGTTSTGTLQQVSGLGSSGQVLTSNGASALPTWQAAGGGSNGFAYLSSNKSVYGGTNTTLSFTGADNVVIGVSAAAALSSGTDNTIIGYQAGNAINTGTFNTILGSLAGQSFIATAGNTAIGYSAGSAETGQHNTFIGYQSGGTASAKNLMVAIGYNALVGYANAIVIGAAASDNYSSSNNYSNLVIIGQGANVGASAGDNWTVIGTGATSGGTTSGNGFGVIVGDNASGSNGAQYVTVVGSNSTGGSYGTTLGAEIHNTGAGTIAIGTFLSLSSAAGCLCFGYATSNYNPTSASNQITFGTTNSTLKDMYLGQGAAGVATPSNVSIQPTPGTGSNVAGGNMTITAGNGTGTGGSGAINFQTAPVAGSSSTANTLATVLSLAASGAITLGATSTTPTHVLNTNHTTGSGVGTWTNVPGAAGNPAGYIQITINGTTSYIPYFQ